MSEFESSVNSDGTQTRSGQRMFEGWFESSVNSDGTQTKSVAYRRLFGLRAV